MLALQGKCCCSMPFWQILVITTDICTASPHCLTKRTDTSHWTSILDRARTKTHHAHAVPARFPGSRFHLEVPVSHLDQALPVLAKGFQRPRLCQQIRQPAEAVAFHPLLLQAHMDGVTMMCSAFRRGIALQR